MRALSFSFAFLLFAGVEAQVTTQCLEIENILVDACSPDMKEGQNEMVRILVGPDNLAVDNIVPVWPNHAFGGWIMNTVTAQKTAELNASVQSCGFLLEPLSGFIPANKKAILVTSWDMNTAANSFAGLTDTMYILYQNTQRGNVGHFANAGTGLRTLTINYLSCSESVTYDRALLVGGDGAYVEFDQNGNATYGNNGCTAPIVPFSIDAGPDPAPVCPGSPAALGGSVVGSYIFLQWSGGLGTFSAPSAANTDYTPAPSESGSFWVYLKVKGVCPDTLKDSVLITVNPLPTVQINQPDFSICPGSTATLSATASGPVAWSNFQIGNSITISAPGQYIAVTANTCGAASDTVVVSLQPLPVVQIDQVDFSICQGSSATVSATGSGPVSWNTGQSGASISISAAGSYIASVTNNCGTAYDTVNVSVTPVPVVQIDQSDFELCPGNTASLSASGNGLVQWSSGQSGSSVLISDPGAYVASVSNSCGTASDTITVSSAVLPQVQVAQDTVTFCQGGTAQLSASGNGTIFWSGGQTGNTITVNNSGIYVASVSNSCGTASDTVTVTQAALPTVSVSASAAVFCGLPVLLTADGSGPVLWNGITSAPTFTATAAGSYTATVTNFCGSVSDTVTLVQGEIPTAQISGPSSAEICSGTDYTVSVQGTGTLIWSNGTNYTLTQAGTYFLVSQTACGTDTAFFTLSVSSPQASFAANPNTGNVPLTVNTVNQSTGAVSYLWNSGNGQSSVGQTPSFVYNQPGEYFLSLLVTDDQGCQDSAVVKITVEQNLEVFLPNVFTPNGDGVNDEYFAVVQGVSEFHMTILNRWGEPVFDSFSADLPWDGKTLHGADAVNGVYFCLVLVKDYYGKTHEYSTTLTLLR